MSVIKYKNAQGKWVALSNYTVQPIEPVQGTGSSTTAIMSQNAVTTELNKKANSTDVYTKDDANETFLSKTEADTTYVTETELNEKGYATTSSVSTAIAETTFNTGHNSVSSIANIPVTKRLVIATITANGSFSLASTPADGREIHVIVHNTSGSDIEITMPSGSNYVKMSGDTLPVAGSSYADINVISDGTNMYIRAL